jgi:hypothetical protein
MTWIPTSPGGNPEMSKCNNLHAIYCMQVIALRRYRAAVVQLRGRALKSFRALRWRAGVAVSWLR